MSAYDGGPQGTAHGNEAPGATPYPPYSQQYPPYPPHPLNVPMQPYSPYAPRYPGEPYQGEPYQGGWLPAGGEQQTPDPRFGKMGKPVWSFRQTLAGTAITLIPWIAFIVLTSRITGGTTTQTQPLPRAADILSAVFVFAFTVIVEGAFLLVPAYYTLRRQGVATRRDGLRALGMRATPLLPALGWVVLGVIFVYAVGALYGLAIQVFHLNLQTNADALMSEAKYAPITVIALLAGAVFVAPFCEEIFFRGFVFTGLVSGMKPWLAGLVSALLFGIAHGDVGSFVPLFAIGLVLAFVRWRTASIWPGMALHAFNNALAAVAVLSVLMHP